MSRLALASLLIVVPFCCSLTAVAEDAAPFTNLPEGWKITKHIEVPQKNLAAIAAQIGGRITSLTSTMFNANGARLQVNVMESPTEADAKVVLDKLTAARGGMNDRTLRRGTQVVEFVCNDVTLARRAAIVLGFKPATVRYRVRFEAAPLVECDPMVWNSLFNAFLMYDKQAGDEESKKRIAALLPKFTFDNPFTLRATGQGPTPSTCKLDPAPQKSEPQAAGDAVGYTFASPPTKANVPCIHVDLTVESQAFARVPTKRSGDASLLAATAFWPVDDEKVAALAAQITAGAETADQKVAALLAWSRPGFNLSFGGPHPGSRYGVLKVLEQRSGYCWDFSDCFITLCRASGVPARQVAGWLYGRSGHVWAEVLVDGHWRQVDPTGACECTTAYIPYLVSEDGRMTLVYLSMPQIEILEPEAPQTPDAGEKP